MCWKVIAFESNSKSFANAFFSLSPSRQCFWTDRRKFFFYIWWIVVVGACDQYPRTYWKESMWQIFNESETSFVRTLLPWALEKIIMAEVREFIQSRISNENVIPYLRYLRNKFLSCALVYSRKQKNRNSETRWMVTQKIQDCSHKAQTG